jgi:hypothetical protein
MKAEKNMNEQEKEKDHDQNSIIANMITAVEFHPIYPKDGLIGFAAVEIFKWLRLTSIGVHQGLDGESLRITIPARKLGSGLNYYFFIKDEAIFNIIADAIKEKVREILKMKEEVVFY